MHFLKQQMWNYGIVLTHYMCYWKITKQFLASWEKKLALKLSPTISFRPFNLIILPFGLLGQHQNSLFQLSERQDESHVP